MLLQLDIQQFALVEHLHLHFHKGLNVLTGETGAGKSILIDALALILGERAQPGYVRPGARAADITAVFDITHHEPARQWLKAQDLEGEEECHIRRIITLDGRSRAFINARPMPLGALKNFASLLLSIHGQHQNQILLKPEHQRSLLDAFAQHPALLAELNHTYAHWQKLSKEREILFESQQHKDKLALLEYQLGELDNLSLKPDELDTLHQEHLRLSQAEQLLSLCQGVLGRLENDAEFAICTALNHVINDLNRYQKSMPELSAARELLQSSLIQIQEAALDINHFSDGFNLDDERLDQLERRLQTIHDLARKHRVAADRLIDHHNQLATEASLLRDAQSRIEKIDSELLSATDRYLKTARALSDSRRKHALRLSRMVSQKMHELAMKHGHFEVRFQELESQKISPHGFDDLEFFVTNNPGLPPQALRKIASGGELSRISLGLEIIFSDSQFISPSLVFDEVDAGISGATAAVVGRLLRHMGETCQVLCVTHLPQVAAHGHHHYKVSKAHEAGKTLSQIIELTEDQSIEELARLLGGAELSAESLANARYLRLKSTQESAR